MKTNFTSKVSNMSLVLMIFFYGNAIAQSSEDTLSKLNGYGQTVYYSPGNEARAKNIAVFMDHAGKFFQKELKFTPRVKLFILDPMHWKQYAAFPVYGMPHYTGHEQLVIAAQDNPFWQSLVPPLDKLPIAMVHRINNSYRKSDGSYSMQPFFDLLALHEMGHAYHEQAGLNMQRKWMQELFVNIMLHTYIAEKQPELLPDLETFPEIVVGGGSAKFTSTTLRDFEEKYKTLDKGSMTAENYGWYQCNLHFAAKNIYNAGGKRVIKKLWTALQKHQEKMSDEDFVAMLKKEVHLSVANVFVNWNKPNKK